MGNSERGGVKTLRRSYKFLLRPTAGQTRSLERMLAAHCDLYNAALEERRRAWRSRRKSVQLSQQSKQLPWIRANIDGQGEWSAWSQQATLKRLDRAYGRFFSDLKAGKKAGPPRFKPRSRWNTVEFLHGNGCHYKPEQSRLQLYGIGAVKVHAHRATKGDIKTAWVTREGKRWYVIFSCDNVPATPLPTTGETVGIDLGLRHFITTSNGEHIANPRWARTAGDQLAAAQRSHALTGYKSAKRKARVTKAHAKIRHQRQDWQRKLAADLVRRYDVIVHEQLHVEQLMRRVPARPDPDKPGQFLHNNAVRKSGVNRSIHDAGWSSFLAKLYAKAEEAGRTVIAVNPANTSLTHHSCGQRGERIHERFSCATCGVTEHADTNAAINILRRGLAPPTAA